MDLIIEVCKAFIDHRDKRAHLFSKGECPTNAGFMRADMELYEWTMCHRQAWTPGKTWATDGHSDKYGHVDVKMIERWWNIPRDKMWNICRQYGIIDHYYFIEKIEWPDGPLLEGDIVTVGWIGVMTYEEVMKRIERSRGDGFYIDARKWAHG